MDAFTEIWRREWPLLVRVAWAVLGDFHDAEDVAQETLMRALDHLYELREPAAFGSWIRTIALHLARDRLRHMTRQLHRHEMEARLGDSGPALAPDPVLLTEAALNAEGIEAALTKLPARQREALLAVAGGESPAEIARRLGVRPGAVRAALHRARERLVDWIPQPSTTHRRRRPGMDRQRIAESIREWGFLLRDTAFVLDVGEGRRMGDAEVVVEHVICDAGMALVLWRLRGEAPVNGLQIQGRRTMGGAPDGLRYAWMDQPQGGTPLRLAWAGTTGRFPDIRWSSNLAAMEVNVPGWDGGRSLPLPARVAGALIGLQGFDYGGLGGRYTVTVDPAEGEQGILALGYYDCDAWPIRDSSGLEPVALDPWTPEQMEPDIPTDDEWPLTLVMRWDGESALAGGGGGRSWDPRSRHQESSGFLLPGLRHSPNVLVFEKTVRWRAVPPGSFVLDETMVGRTFTVRVAPDVVVEVRVFPSESRTLPGQQREERFFVWAHRVRGLRRPNLMRLQGNRWTSLFRSGRDGPGGWQVHYETLESSRQCTIAWTAVGEPLAGLRIPLPQSTGGRCLADAGALARDAAGMPVSAEVAGVFQDAATRGWPASDGVVHVSLNHLLGSLLLTSSGTVLGDLRGSLYWTWLRPRGDPASGDISRVVLEEETVSLLRAAAGEARGSGADELAASHVLVALTEAGDHDLRRWLVEAGLTAHRLRALFGEAAHG